MIEQGAEGQVAICYAERPDTSPGGISSYARARFPVIRLERDGDCVVATLFAREER